MCPPEAEVWSPDLLVQHLDALCLRASLSAIDSVDSALAAELIAICAAGQAEAAFLAAICAVAARSTAGHIMAYGPWAGSALLAHCRAVLGPHPEAPVSPDEEGWRQDWQTSFLQCLAERTAEQPRFLVATLPDGAFLAAVDRERAALGLPPVLAQVVHGGLRVVPPLGPQAECDASPACVDLMVSALWRATLMLGELRQRVEGVGADPLQLCPGRQDAGSVLASPLGAVMPEVPPWAVGLPAPIDPPALQAAWLRACPAPLPAPAEAALQSRALLGWQFAALAAPDPDLAWIALITALDGAERSRLQSAAISAGVGVCEAAESADEQAGATIVRDWLAAHQLDLTPASPDPAGDERVLRFGAASMRALAPRDAEEGTAATAVRLERTDEPERPDADSVACVVGGTAFQVSSGLVNGGPLCRVEVAIDLSGDHNPDLDLIARVERILDEHPGPLPVRLLLRRPTARRTLNRSGVTWSSQMAQSLEAVAGTGCTTLRPLGG
jgi:hypothetical protein